MRILGVFLLVSNLALADNITFRDGHTVNGSFLGGDARNIRVAVNDRVETYSVADIARISFTDAPRTTSVNEPPSEPRVLAPPVLREPPPPPREEVRRDEPRRDDSRRDTIPSGTVLTVRMVDSVDSQRDKVGQTFQASLDEPVIDPDGRTLIPRGADVLIKLVDDQQSGKIEGRTVLTLDVVSLRVNGRDVEIDTTAITEQSGSRTARSAKVIGGTAVLGTIIGAIAGGGKGAAIGAASGAGVGTAAQVATKGQRVRIPSETRLTFTLQQPVRL
jgi:hypothetical protein